MDNSVVPLVMQKGEDHLDTADNLNPKEVAKSLDHSPARSSVKSAKSTNDAKITSLADSNKNLTKTEINADAAHNLNPKEVAKSLDHSPARSGTKSTNDADSNKNLTKTESNVDAVDNLNSKEGAKSLDHSPARSGVKSVKSAKSTNDAKITRLADSNKNLPKTESKSSISAVKNVNIKDCSVAGSEKITSPANAKSPSSLMSKIPAMKKRLTVNSKNAAEQIPFGHKREPQKFSQQRAQPEKKQVVEAKRKPIVGTNFKSSLSKAEPLQPDKPIASNISKSNSVMSTTNSNHSKRTSKCQSIRSNPASPLSCANKRSASNISTRSTPCPRTKCENVTNLRKIISIAGDYKGNDNMETGLEDDQKETAGESVKTSKLVEKCQIKTHMDQYFLSLNKSNLCDAEQLELLKSHDMWSLINDWIASAAGNGVDKFKKELEESNKTLKNFKQKYNDLEERCKLEKISTEKIQAEIVRKDELIKEFQKKSKMQEKQINALKAAVQNLENEKNVVKNQSDQLLEELKISRDCFATANKKLHDSEQQLKQDKKDVKCKIEMIQKLENDLVDKKKMETDLAEATKKLNELQTKTQLNVQSECVEHSRQIAELTKQVNSLETDKKALEQQKEKLLQEINDFEKMQEKLLETKSKLEELQIELDNREKSPELVKDYSKEVQLELAKLRQSEAEKCREIENLKTELSKTQFNICQLEQQVQRDQQLLEVRSVLINSLQANEKTHRIHIEELFAQVGEKNNTINELNSELQSKSEEFRNLFTTLNSKQMEVANQEHIVKLLEESNERSQMLRVKQEEKIGRLEEELAHLKQTIAIYQANVLAGNNGRNLLYAPMLTAANVDCNENLYYYVSQRKRKRQIDINVKKYEA